MNLRVTDEIKNDIISFTNKYPKVFDKNDVEMLVNNFISKELCIKIIENVMYDCQCMRSTIKSHTIYSPIFELAETIYLSIPKSPDYEEDSGIFYENIPEFKNMSNEKLLFVLSEVFKMKNMFQSVLKQQNITNRAERILQSIESLSKQSLQLSEFEENSLNNIYSSIKKKLGNLNDFNLQIINNNIILFNNIAENIWKRCLDEGRYYLVHNFSRGNVDNFVPSKYLSTSLISNRFMALFQENNNNNYGFVVKPEKIVSAYWKDTFTDNRSKNIGMDMYLSGKVPPILFPWEIEEEAIKNSLNKNGEILNYDNGYILPEIVLESYEQLAVYYRTNGEGTLSPSYDAAYKLAKTNGLELKELDLSLARMQLGLEPMTAKMQKMFFLNLIRKNYMDEKTIKKYFGKYNFFEQFKDEKIISKYLDKMYDIYLHLKKAGKLDEKVLLKEIISVISLEDTLIIKNFYYNINVNLSNELLVSNEGNNQQIIQDGKEIVEDKNKKSIIEKLKKLKNKIIEQKSKHEYEQDNQKHY